MSVNGLAGRVLVVDLAQRTAEASPLNMAMVERFGGGLGLCIGLARQYLDPSCDALGPSNTVVIGAGALVGTDAPASSRVYAVAKLPASGSVGWCGAGGMTFGCQLKNAGFDHVVLQGASPEPVYLLIENDRVEIRDASMLRGQGTGETCDFLIKTHAPAGVISIGTAGENLVSFSMAYLDGVSTLGRGGLGAVFGAKNLKAVVVRGSRGVGVADPGAYRALSGSLIERIRSYPHLESWQDLGLLASLPVVSPDVYRRMRIRRMACVSCPIGDKDVMVVPTGDGAHRYACTSSAVNLFMPLVYGMKDPAEASGCVALLDELGMDMFEFFGLLSWAQAAQNKGTDFACGAPVDVSSSESVRSWAYAVANRMGMGDVLAEGFRGIARAFGEDALDAAPPVSRGMVTYVGPSSALPWDLFGTMELGQLLDPRGPHVGASGSPTYFAKRDLETFPDHLQRMGVPSDASCRIIRGLGTPSASLSVGRLLRYSHRWFTMLGILGVCARAQVNRFYNAELCARLYEAVTGIPTTVGDLARRADRAWTVLHLMNLECGAGVDNPVIPKRWIGEGGFREYVTGRPLGTAEIVSMIGDYREEQGWDRDTGVPRPERLAELGIHT